MEATRGGTPQAKTIKEIDYLCTQANTGLILFIVVKGASLEDTQIRINQKGSSKS
jgi:hypothetical protein